MNVPSKSSVHTGPLFMCLLTLLFTMPTFAMEGDVEVPFLFSQDDTLPQTRLREAVPSYDALRTDQYLNGPVTRLEYMLMMLEARLNDETWSAITRDELAKGFHPLRDKPTNAMIRPSVKGRVRYDAATGRVLVGYEIDDLGQPSRPMSTTCHEILSRMKFIAPQRIMGFTYHNTVLGVLAQRDYSEYTASLETLAKGIVHIVRLESRTNDYSVIHNLGCLQHEESAPVVFERHSLKRSSVR